MSNDTTFQELLDESLAKRGQGSMEDMAERLSEGSDLSQVQIYRHLRDWRNEIRQGLAFDLAMQLAVAVPELAMEIARRRGQILVDVAEIGPTRLTQAGASSRALASAAAAVQQFLEAAEDGIITPGERRDVGAICREAEAAIERIRVMVDAAVEGGGKL